MNKKTHQGILIDPVEKTVTDVVVDAYPGWKEVLKCDDINAVTIIEHADGFRETIWVDGEGLLAAEPGPFFMWEGLERRHGYPNPLCGRGLVLGTDTEGETQSTRLTADMVRPYVSYPNIEFEGFTYHDYKIDHPVFGADTPVHEQRPHYRPKRKLDQPQSASGDPEGEERTSGT